ncbi:SdpA family antimicrobial peptide system protein [Staphylococcus pseudintermedius]|nr:SdpA family antimicrobial peptide system protein [Staphylococcus pseudintermedius]MDK3843747.1 SdpA family antimicrobial peptide system protein [Staphylococcus pseudintermedius]
MKKRRKINLSKYSSLFIFCSCLYIIVFFVSIQNVFPNNPIKEKTFKVGSYIYDFFPQGWAFYSKNPRELTYNVVYTQSGENATQFPNASPSNYLGLIRKGRAQGIEAGRLVANLRDSDWKETEEDPVKFGRSLRVIEVKNDLQKPTIKGDILVYYQEPVPWSWAKTFKNNEYMPSKVARILVV